MSADLHIRLDFIGVRARFDRALRERLSAITGETIVGYRTLVVGMEELEHRE